MVATLLGLKLHLVVADLKRSTARLVIWILFALYALSMIAMILVGLIVASMAITGNEEMASAITIIAGSILVMGWTLLPLIFFGADQTLDPARFAHFPVTGTKLAPGLLLAGAIGLPGLATAVICLGTGLPWWKTPAVLVMGVISGLLGFLLTQIGCRVASTALSGTLSSRKAKDLTGLIGLVVVLVMSMGVYGVSMGINFFALNGNPAEAMMVARSTATVLAWTPLGAPWAIVGAAGQGYWLMALVYLGLTLVYIVAGVWLYAKILDKALITPTIAVSTADVGKGDIINSVTRVTKAQGSWIPVAAILARSLRYWRRDPRYMGQIPAILMMPIMFGIIGWGTTSFADPSTDASIAAVLSKGMIAFGLGFMALMAGYSLSADVASDSTAWWTHLATGVKGWQDRLGRVLGQLIWAAPVIILVGIIASLFLFDASRIPSVMGALMALYLCGLGLSSLFSALIIYPVALPGESPLKMKTGMMGLQMLSQFGSLIIAGLLALPLCIWAIFATGVQAWLVLILGLVWGAILLILGVILGGKIMDSRGPQILASLTKNDSRERA
ncbi:MAG: hypothetical protein LBG99_01485 [Propionibacteriaceae bacterium]|jgi:ABC-2 type transport system permease protein|nr:hypothetical protein [Propionibacteriaceae bacterium]